MVSQGDWKGLVCEATRGELPLSLISHLHECPSLHPQVKHESVSYAINIHSTVLH